MEGYYKEGWLGVDWIHLAPDKFPKLMNTVMNSLGINKPQGIS
jgi:hypothetical protein